LIRNFGISDKGINASLDGAGLYSIVTDPTDRNLVIIEAYADIPYKMAMINQFTWQNTSLGFPLAASFSDRVVESGNKTYRHTGASLSGKFNWSMGQWNYGFSLGGAYVRNANYDGGKSAYEWEEAKNSFRILTGISLSYRRLGLQLSGVSYANSFEPRIDGIFGASADTRFPLRLALFGAYDEGGMDLHGTSSNYGERLTAGHFLTEYPHPKDLDLFWLGGSEIAVDLFSFEIQKNLSHAYFNRLLGTFALRSQVYDSNSHPDAEGIELNNLRLAQSLALKLFLKTTFFPIVKYPAVFEPYLWGAWKFSNTLTGQGFPWYFSIGFNIHI
jgi:hypothetical protein